MGKGEEEQPVGTSLDAQSTHQNAENRCRGCSRLKGLLSFKCVFVLLLGMGVLLSAIFLLPFFKNGDLGYLDLDDKYKGHDIVGSFMLEKPVPFVKDYIVQLADDIFDEISVSSTKVKIMSLENIAGSNITEVVFAVDSAVKNIRVSLTALSLVRGGITVSPSQSGFLMQQVQILFNFTLNFSIDEIQDKFHELTSQLKSELVYQLDKYKRFTCGSSRYCSVHSSFSSWDKFHQVKVEAVVGSHSDNLGLNNTVFGRVKQVSLSSFLPHSRGGDSGSLLPSLAPLPHHHHHHHNRDSNLAPAISPAPRVEKGGSISRKVSPVLAPAPASVTVLAPAPAPAPAKHKSHEAQPPCHFGRYPRKLIIALIWFLLKHQSMHLILLPRHTSKCMLQLLFHMDLLHQVHCPICICSCSASAKEILLQSHLTDILQLHPCHLHSLKGFILQNSGLSCCFYSYYIDSSRMRKIIILSQQNLPLKMSSTSFHPSKETT